MFKKVLAASVAAVLVLGLSGCVLREVPRGEERSETWDLEEFDSIVFSGFGSVTLEQDDDYEVEISAQEVYLDRFDVEVRGDTLYIEWDDRWLNIGFPWSEPDIQIVITAPEYRRLEVSGAGEVTADRLEAKRFEFELSGAGTLYGRDVEIGDLVVNLSGAGSVDLSGEAVRQRATVSGVGSYEAANLRTDDTEVEMSGAGSAVVWAEEYLDVAISGAGSVEYYGDPHVSQDISGAGSVHHRGSR